MQADQADLDAFQEKLMHDRQRGLFFKSLYTDPKVVKRMRARRGQHAVTVCSDLDAACTTVCSVTRRSGTPDMMRMRFVYYERRCACHVEHMYNVSASPAPPPAL